MTAKIISAKIGPFPTHLFDANPKVHAFFDDNSDEVLFDYYFDEISFTEKELIGLTKNEAIQLKYKKDLAFLRS